MYDAKYQELLQTLSYFIENSIPKEFLIEQINPNYYDSEGNNYLHYLSKYTFNEYIINNNSISKKEIINKEKYKSLLYNYLKIISSYVNLLNDINCDFIAINIYEEIPLESCLNKQNYYLSKEYIKYNKSFSYNKILDIIFSFCNFTNEEYLDFILFLFNNEYFKNEGFLKIYFEEKNYIPIISMFKNYNQNIYDKYNLFLKINIIEYLHKNNKGIYEISPGVETKNNIIKNSIDDLHKFCLAFLNTLKNIILNLEVKISNIYNNENLSLLMYLMAYPDIPNLISFITKNNININYQDKFGRTALMHLINNKNNIININKHVYDNAFKELINYNSINLSIRDNYNISAFILCLINDYYEDAKHIYDKKIIGSEFDIILLFIIKIYQNKFNKHNFSNITNIIKKEINYDCFDKNNNRTLLHYYFMFNSENFENFKNNLDYILNIISEKNKKDIFNRNCLFYLFIDYCGDPRKIQDPYNKLEYCLKNDIFNIDLNEYDIFGNNLLFYAIKSNFLESIKILIKNGVYLTNSINNEGNTIYTTSLMINNDIFLYLYNLIKNPEIILGQKLYKFYDNYNCFINNLNEDNKTKDDVIKDIEVLNMYNFFNNPELILSVNYNINLITNKMNKLNINEEMEKKYYIYNNKESQYSFLNIQHKDYINIINNYFKNNFNYVFDNPIRNTQIKIDNSNIMDIKKILQNPNILIDIILNQEKTIISDNLYEYCKNNNKNIIIYNIFDNKKYNIITICKDLLELKKYNNLIENLKKIIKDNEGNKLINLKSEDGQNIFHILSMIIPENKNIEIEIDSIYNNLYKYNINRLFDSKGNTPIYYACKRLNKKFIEKFSNYIFEKKNNDKFNSSLFIESDIDLTPLEELYKKINLEDNYLISLIIDITLREKKGYILYILKYLTEKYNTTHKNLFNQSFLKNLASEKYLNKIIGLYQFLRNELKVNLMIFDNEGYDPSILCAINNNFDFLFDILLYGSNKNNLIKNSANKEGKTVIHFLIEIKNIKNKEEKLIKLLNEGFAFNNKDIKGFYPIDYAYFNKDKKIIDILKDKYYKEGLPLKINLRYNFYRDSDILFNESILDSSNYQKCDDLFGLVYKKFKCAGDKIHKVVTDNESIPYNANLLRGNIFYHECLFNRYVIQLLENTDKKTYIVATFEKDEIYNEYKYNNLNEAEIKFKKIFKAKTDNDWDNIKNDKRKFKTNYIKFYYFDYNFEQENDIYDYLKVSINNLMIKKEIIYDENITVRDLIYYLARRAYNNRFINENNKSKKSLLNKDVENNTRDIIKRYKEKGLNDAVFLLKEIEKIVKKGENLNEFEKKKISYLISSYEELIPFSVYKSDINILKTIDDINKEIGRISTYYFIENILKIFLGAIKNIDEIHPLDYIINSLGCDIILLEEETQEKINIKKFLNKGGADKIKNIFKIKNSINDINFNPNNFKKRYIFCHGTKTENILGILSQGLKISPVQANFSGQSYGVGIYLSNSYNVSINYSKNKQDINKDERFFMLLVEAALGEEKNDYNVYRTNLNFNNVYMTEEGYGIFNLVQSEGIIVIKDEMNVRVKYIIEI